MTLNDINEIINNPARLRWACRRGMLELDVLLGNFLTEAFPQLDVADKIRFVNILSQSDPELFAWLMGKELPEDPDFKRITDLIRQHAQSRI